MLIRAICLLLLISSNVSYAGLFGDDKAREQISALRQQVEEMDARIAKMEEALKSQALLELYTQVETLGMELGRLRGQIEVLTNDNTSLQKRQKDFYIDLDSRLRQIEDPDAPIPSYSNPVDSVDTDTDAVEDSVSPSSERHTSIISAPRAVHEDQTIIPAETEKTYVAAIPDHDLTPAGTTEKQTYDAAYRLFVNGDYVSAKSQFEAFLNQYPQSTLAPSAAYWIGNAHYALRDFQDAIDAQRDLIRRYPDSAKVPDALLNIASSQHEMADSKAAKETLENLITQYPLSDAARKASQRVTRF